MSVSQTDIRAVVVAALQRIAPGADISALAGSADIRDTLDLDSYDFLQFLIALHKQLGVDVPEADYGKVGTLDQVTTYLVGRCK